MQPIFIPLPHMLSFATPLLILFFPFRIFTLRLFFSGLALCQHSQRSRQTPDDNPVQQLASDRREDAFGSESVSLTSTI
ncbi:hypothetical protein V8F06_011954 [Rhypophila decipiens]